MDDESSLDASLQRPCNAPCQRRVDVYTSSTPRYAGLKTDSHALDQPLML